MRTPTQSAGAHGDAMPFDNPLTDPGTIRDAIRSDVDALERALDGITDEEAMRTPRGDTWTVKQVLYNLRGPDHGGFIHDVLRILEETDPELEIDTPRVDDADRLRVPVDTLAREVGTAWRTLAVLVAGLDEVDYSRRARVPELEDAPGGTHATLTQYMQALHRHLASGVGDVRRIREALAKEQP